MVHSENVQVRTGKRAHWVDVSREVGDVVSRSGIRQGVVTVCSLHTTAGMTINENADPDVERDFFWKLADLIPRDDGYHHSEGNSDSHLKTGLVGSSVQVIVREGRAVLGTWQSIYLCEFDGPRNRTMAVMVMGE